MRFYACNLPVLKTAYVHKYIQQYIGYPQPTIWAKSLAHLVKLQNDADLFRYTEIEHVQVMHNRSTPSLFRSHPHPVRQNFLPVSQGSTNFKLYLSIWSQVVKALGTILYRMASSFSMNKIKVISNKVCIMRLYAIGYYIFRVNRLIFSSNLQDIVNAISCKLLLEISRLTGNIQYLIV